MAYEVKENKIVCAKQPEQAGIRSAAVLAFLKELSANEIVMHSVQLMHKGMLAYEGYYAPCRKGEPHRMFSVSKTLTALAIGALIRDGVISIEDKIAAHFPEYVSEDTHPWILQMTIRDMLMMRTCHSQTTYKFSGNNWVESFFTVKPDHKPGTVFHYDTSSAHTLCALVEKKTGQPMMEYLKAAVLREIGFSEEAYMLKDPYGTSIGGSGLVANEEDLLRLGMFLMNRGVWNGKQLLPADFMEQMTSRLSATAVKGPIPSECLGYGYMVWCGREDSFVCYGMGGQLVICLPKEDLICVTTADTQGYQGANQYIYNALYKHIVPGLMENANETTDEKDDLLETGEITDADYNALCAYTETLRIEPLNRYGFARFGNEKSGQAFGGVNEEKISACQKEFRFEKNAQGFESMALKLHSDGSGVLQYVLNGEECALAFGFDMNVQGRFPRYDLNCAASGVWLDDQTFYIKVHILDTSCCSVHIQLFFDEKDVTVFMKENDEMILTEYKGHLYGHATE